MAVKKVKGDMVKPAKIIFDQPLFPGDEIDMDLFLDLSLQGSRWVFGLGLADGNYVSLIQKDTYADPPNGFPIDGVGDEHDVAQLRVTKDDTGTLQPGDYQFDVQYEDAFGRRFRVAFCERITFASAYSDFDLATS